MLPTQRRGLLGKEKCLVLHKVRAQDFVCAIDGRQFQGSNALFCQTACGWKSKKNSISSRVVVADGASQPTNAKNSSAPPTNIANCLNYFIVGLWNMRSLSCSRERAAQRRARPGASCLLRVPQHH